MLAKCQYQLFNVTTTTVTWCKRWLTMWVDLQPGSAIVCLSRGHREDIDRSHWASEPHVFSIRLPHQVLSMPVCVCAPFHALFSPSPCETVPSVSKFICHTSGGLVWSRGEPHTLLMAMIETQLKVCAYECVTIYLQHVLSCLLFQDVYPLTSMFALLWERCV